MQKELYFTIFDAEMLNNQNFQIKWLSGSFYIYLSNLKRWIIISNNRLNEKEQWHVKYH